MVEPIDPRQGSKLHRFHRPPWPTWAHQVLAAQSFHAAAGDPPNLKLCRRAEWNDRLVVETVLSLMTVVSHLKPVRHRCWDYLLARLAVLVTTVNMLLQGNGLPADAQGFVPLSMAEFSL